MRKSDVWSWIYNIVDGLKSKEFMKLVRAREAMSGYLEEC